METFTRTLATKLGRALRDLQQVPQNLAKTVDNTLHNFADAQLDNIYDARKQVAMQDPKYAAIEARRTTSKGYSVMLDDKVGLGMDELDYQYEVFNKATEEPFITPVYRFLKDYPIKSFLNKMRYAKQRLTRGWDDTATWSLDHHLCLTLGTQLHHLADTTHGWPQSIEFPEFEDWQAALRTNGDILLAYANKDDVMFSEGETYTLERDNEYAVEAGEALRWVAANLNSLWD